MSARIPIWSILSVSALALLALSARLHPSPILLYNPSESAPVGWYRVLPLAQVSRGDLVAAKLLGSGAELASARGYLPENTPIIKTVYALAGDTVCETHGNLEINGKQVVRVLARDASRRLLPSPWTGCEILGPGEVLLLSTRTPHAFDGRYFGSVDERDILGRAVWLGDENQEIDSEDIDVLRKKSVGECDCKIKDHRTNQALTHCLHIDFYGSSANKTALWSDRFPNSCNRSQWFYAKKDTCFRLGAP